MKQRENNARTKKMLITGADGLLGSEIFRAFSPGYDILRTDREECDVTSPAECLRVIGGFGPQVVIHCAAFTAVDQAEREEGAAFELNAGGTRNVAAACRDAGALFVTFGTDYVFDGRSGRPYAEDDPTGPLSAYGRSKLAAEEAIREVGPEFLLVRTQWLFGLQGRNFALSILERADRGEELKVVCDQKGSPTYCVDLAEAVGRLLDAGARGTFHFSNEGETTFFDYAAYLLNRSGRRGTRLSPVFTADLSRDRYPAPRPLFAVLSKKKYRETTGVAPRRWEEAVSEVLDRLRQERRT